MTHRMTPQEAFDTAQQLLNASAPPDPDVIWERPYYDEEWLSVRGETKSRPRKAAVVRIERDAVVSYGEEAVRVGVELLRQLIPGGLQPAEGVRVTPQEVTWKTMNATLRR